MNIIHDYFAEIGAVIGIIVWLIRIEGLTSMHTKEINSLDKRLTDFDSKILAKLSEIAERLSYIEGSIRGDHGKK